MSFQITEAFVQQYRDNVLILAQQKGSRLREAVAIRDGVVGKRTSFERIGGVSMVKRTTRHADTPLVETPHSRRWCNLEDYEFADLVDDQDRIRLLISPESEYAINAGYAAGRTFDQIIIAAMQGSAVTGEEATGTQALPAGQILALGTGGNNKMNVGKLRSIITSFRKANHDMGNLHIAMSAEGFRQLLETTEVTSADFASVKALVNGDINAFLGLKFHHTEELGFATGTQRYALAWNMRSVGLAIGKDVVTRMTERADKSYALQTYLCFTLGAVRIEDTGVVQTTHDEAL
jgi:hypothetical protein